MHHDTSAFVRAVSRLWLWSVHMRSDFRVMSALVLVLAACQQKAATFDPNDPVATAQIDSIMKDAVAGASNADVDKTLKMAEGPGEFTFITGDLMLTGFAPIKKAFAQTYAALRRQTTDVTSRRIRLLSPDVALFTATGEGTYTDKAGHTSSPVGLGYTIIFVKQNGRWQAEHAHQSIAP
jgi:uncharacterized protein (TIGR02246 family)